jgi:type I restriction enzyme S subunit
VKDAVLEKRLGDVVDVQSGFAFKSSEYSDSGHFLIRIANVQDGYLSLEKPKYVALNAKTKRFELRAGDILTSLTGNVGRVAKVEPEHLPAALNQRVARLVPKPDAGIDAQYLLRFLHSSAFSGFLEERAHGAAQANVSPSVIGEIPIPLPPLEEQQRIVAVLDEAFEGLARARVHAEANLQNARALIEAGLGTAFNPVTAKLNGWDLSDLSSMAKLSYGYTTKANSEPNGPKFLRITDIQDGTVDWDNVPFCSTPPDDYERYRVKSGDILFARTGATTGKSYLMTDEIEAVAASYLIRLRLASMALKPEYLALFFQSDVYWETIRAGISGSTQGGFNASKLGELVVPVPPLAIQDVVISRLEEIQDQAARLTSTYFVKLQDLDDLRQSLLQKAFAGELT